jgi:hypothetical protein
VADRIPVIAGQVARRIGARLPDLTPEMTTMFIDIIPEFRHDQAVQRLMVAGTASNLGAVVDMLIYQTERQRWEETGLLIDRRACDHLSCPHLDGLSA